MAVVGGAGGGAGGSMGAMNRYITLQALGDGTYGSVMLGQRVDTGEKVGKVEVEVNIEVKLEEKLEVVLECSERTTFLPDKEIIMRALK